MLRWRERPRVSGKFKRWMNGCCWLNLFFSKTFFRLNRNRHLNWQHLPLFFSPGPRISLLRTLAFSLFLSLILRRPRLNVSIRPISVQGTDPLRLIHTDFQWSRLMDYCLVLLESFDGVYEMTWLNEWIWWGWVMGVD